MFPVQPGDGGCGEMLGLRDCEGGVGRAREMRPKYDPQYFSKQRLVNHFYWELIENRNRHFPKDVPKRLKFGNDMEISPIRP